VKSLIVSSRFPWPPYTGDRLRATIWLSALARDGEVSLVAPQGDVPEDAERIRFFSASRSLSRGVRRSAAVVRNGFPLQCLLAAAYDWDAAIDRARREAGPFDVTVVLLSRLHPWVRASLDGRTVLDAVDSLRRNAEEREKAAPPGLRWLWRAEGRRMERVEREAARDYGRVVVVSGEETAELRHAVAVTNGIATSPLNGHARTFDFGFWGRLPYFANADAASWLLNEIWPAIQARRPNATLVIGGAGAPRALREAARRAGVTLVSPIDDVAAFARTIRVALMPLRYGSGQSNKVLEAAEAGCAIVATPEAMRGLAPLARHARVERSAEELARAAVELAEDDHERGALTARLRETVERDYSRATTMDKLAAIAEETARFEVRGSNEEF
jgi:glycosyltransferase involved in cell wall biosynthesis